MHCGGGEPDTDAIIIKEAFGANALLFCSILYLLERFAMHKGNGGKPHAPCGYTVRLSLFGRAVCHSETNEIRKVRKQHKQAPPKPL